MLDVTVPYSTGRLHLVPQGQGAAWCQQRDSHRAAAIELTRAAVRQAMCTDASAAAALRRLLVALQCEAGMDRLGDDAVAEQLVQLAALRRLQTIACGSTRVVPREGVPPPNVPVHIGRAGTDFVCPEHGRHVALSLRDAASVQQLLGRLQQDPAQQAELRRAVFAARAGSTGGAAGEDLFGRAAALLLAGELCAVACLQNAPLRRRPPLAVVSPAAPKTPRPAPAKEVAKTWIEFHLVRSSDRTPVAGARYQLKLVDGSIRTGQSDDDGVVYIKNIDPGTCELSLLDYEAKEWRRS